jgi:lipooligosaccharide transport system permease protein
MAVDLDPAAGPTVPDAPSRRRGRPMALRALGYYAYAYRRTWRSSLATSFMYPVLYLAAMGVGVGTLVTQHSHTVDGVSYLDFVAPGLLAATAMQIGSNESMYPVMAAIKWIRTYFAMLATPLGVDDVLAGHLLWVAVRLTTVSAIYLVVMAAFGTVLSPLAVFGVPAAILTGVAFAAPLSAYAATQTNETGFSTIYRLGLIPLFLFSGTFFPISQLPGWLQVVARLTPLYHGTDLCRALCLGQVDGAAMAADVAYLVALAAAGALAARRTYRRRLVV